MTRPCPAAAGLAIVLLLAPGTAAAAAVWCTLSDGVTTYVSDIKDIATLSRSRLRARSSRFTRVVNAAHAGSFPLDGRACRSFADHSLASRALAAYRLNLGTTTIEQVVIY